MDHESTMLSVAFNGADNTGKTTQIGLLARRIGPAAAPAGALHDHDSRWTAIQGDMAGWWFGTGPIEEVVDVLVTSYLARSAAPGVGSLRLLDRGIPMLEASVAATVAVRENLAAPAAADRARALLEPWATDLRVAEDAELSLYLAFSEDIGKNVARSLAHQASVTPPYDRYQQILHERLHDMHTKERRFKHTVMIGDRSIVEVQREIRRVLHPWHSAVPARALDGVQIIALAGLSESGKSTAGEYLRMRHGHARLKLGWLLDTAAAHAGIPDPYAVTEDVQAELIVDALDRYLTAHYYVKDVTIESLHSLGSTAALRRLLGRQVTVTYLDTPMAARRARSETGADDVVVRDVVKEGRGADRIAGIADRVIDNSGTRLGLERCLDAMVLDRHWPARHPEAQPVNMLGLPISLESYLGKLLDRTTGGADPVVDLLAVTGSGARGEFQSGWSDLDVFVVSDNARLDALADVLAELRADLEGVKLGISVVTLAECRAGNVSVRLQHVLAQIGAGAITPLWVRNGLRLPAPDPAAIVAATVMNGVQATFDIRRQILAGAGDLRTLYKVTGVSAKVQLEFRGVPVSADEDALTRLLGAHGHDTSLARTARTDRDAALEAARIVLDLWNDTMNGVEQ
ncbi:nucleotidyltransferase domain-containing protein [Streptomyces sp. H27-H1]|uniref:nucleotidyltransferase domain-containing protein n=1 Tax=Streptomyces sp. H27-H1 TaxID=2996461 RepID=UPI00226F10E4|nr:nucleotidyltransferase domain-containing protein [Streptomyces sp. H27-H1]MCY0929170.1 nucleotidyltransferase domain-containing protein [Streptomyces sp. H27-H1]